VTPLETIACGAAGIALTALFKVISDAGELRGRLRVLENILETDRRTSHQAAGGHSDRGKREAARGVPSDV
jgi:hypothetical protein